MHLFGEFMEMHLLRLHWALGFGVFGRELSERIES